MVQTDRSREDISATPSRLPDSAHVGRVRLAVSHLGRSIAFYRDGIGLAILSQNGSLAQLGAHGDTRTLLELEEQPGVHSIAQHSRLGLYHTAFLLPTRQDLSGFVQHLRRKRIPFAAADHSVSEALYLVDPDGLEVEVYADRPRSEWPHANGHLQMGTVALRFDTLPRVVENSWQGAPAGTTVGHVHFYVGHLRQAEAFYCAGLGFAPRVRMPSALFAAAGGYHHHVGLNTWAAGSPVASRQDARLLHWELALPNAAEVDRVTERMLRAGYRQRSATGASPTFADNWGIAVALAAR